MFSEFLSSFFGFSVLMLSITRGEKGLSASSVGTAGTFERTVSSRRTGVADDLDVLSIWMWSFDVFAVSEDLGMRLAG
jgi:hypothetical protein